MGNLIYQGPQVGGKNTIAFCSDEEYGAIRKGFVADPENKDLITELEKAEADGGNVSKLWLFFLLGNITLPETVTNTEKLEEYLTSLEGFPQLPVLSTPTAVAPEVAPEIQAVTEEIAAAASEEAAMAVVQNASPVVQDGLKELVKGLLVQNQLLAQQNRDLAALSELQAGVTSKSTQIAAAIVESQNIVVTAVLSAFPELEVGTAVPQLEETATV